MTTNPPVYPCDRGIKGNVSSRGWHNFVAGAAGVVACTFCGQRGPGPQPWSPPAFPPMPRVYKTPFSTDFL